MKRKKGEFLNRRNRLLEISFHDFIQMMQRGLDTEEIAKELGVHKEDVEKLKSKAYENK